MWYVVNRKSLNKKTLGVNKYPYIIMSIRLKRKK